MKSMTAGVVLSLVMLAGCSKEAAPTAEEATAEKDAPAATASQQKAPAAKPAAKPKPAPLVLAAGTSLTVRTTSTLSTKSASAGESFTATLEKPLTVGER